MAKTKVEDLNAAVAEATAALSTDETPEVNAAPAEEGTKSAPEQAPVTVAANPDVTAAVGSALDAIVNEIEEGAKSAAREELRAQIDEAVKNAVAGYQRGRKTPQEVSVHNQSVGPAVIKQRGEQASFGLYLAALGRKALGYSDAPNELRDIYFAAGGKAMYEGTGASLSNGVSGPNGGFLVPPEYNRQLIEYLYAYTTLRAAGVTVIPMKSNIYYQPRMSATAQATWVGENQPIPPSQPAFGQFQLTAKKLTALTPITRELVEDSDPAIEQIVRSDLGRQLGLAEDYAWLVGVGSNTVPQGILTAPGIIVQSVTAPTTGDAASYGQIVGLQTAMAVANVPVVRRVFICHPSTLAAYRNVMDNYGRPLFADFDNVQNSTLTPANGPAGAMRPSGTLFGIPVYCSTQIPLVNAASGNNVLGTLALVELSQVLAGQRGQIEMDATTQATYIDNSGNAIGAFQNDLVLYRALMREDIGLLHPQGVAVQPGIVVGTHS